MDAEFMCIPGRAMNLARFAFSGRLSIVETVGNKKYWRPRVPPPRPTSLKLACSFLFEHPIYILIKYAYRPERTGAPSTADRIGGRNRFDSALFGLERDWGCCNRAVYAVSERRTIKYKGGNVKICILDLFAPPGGCQSQADRQLLFSDH